MLLEKVAKSMGDFEASQMALLPYACEPGFSYSRAFSG